MPADDKRIGLFLSKGDAGTAEIRLGVMRYTHAHRPWRVLPGGQLAGGGEDIVFGAVGTDLDGAIGVAGRRDLAEAARSLSVPFVNCFGGRPFRGLPQVGADDIGIGRLAAEHLAERGFEQYAFVGRPRGGASASRWLGFREELARRGRAARRYVPSADYGRVKADRPFLVAGLAGIAAFLARLPKPVGVFCVDDTVAGWVSDVCDEMRWAVPEQVAVLGVGDGPLCEEAAVAFSSLRLPLRQVGFDAARLLHAILRGEPAPQKPLLLPPEGVAVRRSTETLAVDEPDVVRALRFIREHAAEGITVENVLDETPLSRRGLDGKFRRCVGHTVYQEIRRVQLDRARRLLHETDLSMEKVAAMSGFSGGRYFSQEFRRRTGQTPSAYRRQFRRA